MSTTPSNPSNHIAHTLLSRAHSPQTATAIFHEKVLQKPLFLLPTNDLSTSLTPLITLSANLSNTTGTTTKPLDAPNARTTRRLTRLHKKAHYLSHRKPRPLSAKEKRRLGVYDVPKEARKYAVYEGLHRLWVGYMWEVLGLRSGEGAVDGDGDGAGDAGGSRGEGRAGSGGGGGGAYVTAQSAGSKLASADFHGAEVEVVRSRCVGRVGVRGIVVRDTKFTFEVVTRGHVVKVIPKEHTIFKFEIPQPPGKGVVGDGEGEGAREGGGLRNLVFELHGSQFENRAPERATKKFKQRNMSDL